MWWCFLLGFTVSLFLFETGNYYEVKWEALLLGSAVTWAWAVSKRTHWSVFLPLAYSLVVPIAFSIGSSHISLSGDWPTVLRWSMASAAFSLVIVVTVFSHLPSYSLKYFVFALIGFCIAQSLFVFYQYWQGTLPFGFLGETSMGLCFLGLCLPFFLLLPGHWKWGGILPVIAIFMGISASALVVFGVVVSAYAFSQVKRARIPVAVGLLVLVGLVSYIRLSTYLSNDMPRLMTYKGIWLWWIGSGKALLGHGMGFLHAAGPHLIRGTGVTGYWFHAHSDALKALVELGVVGSVLCVVPIGVALRRAFDKPELFASLCGAVVLLVIQYPVFMPAHFGLLAFLFIAALRNEPLTLGPQKTPA